MKIPKSILELLDEIATGEVEVKFILATRTIPHNEIYMFSISNGWTAEIGFACGACEYECCSFFTSPDVKRYEFATKKFGDPPLLPVLKEVTKAFTDAAPQAIDIFTGLALNSPGQ